MNITTRGWDNLYLPDKVFVEKIQPLQYDFEYSETKPATYWKLEDLLNGYYAYQNYIELFYCLPEVFAPVHEIASRVSDAVWQLRKWKNDEIVYDNNDFNRLFSQPNPLNTIRQLVYQAVCYEIVVGKNFFFKNNPSMLAQQMSSIVAWWNLPADMVIADLKQNFDAYSANSITDFVKQYKIPNDTNSYRIFDVKNVLPVVNYSLNKPTDINCAKSLLKGADKAIRNLIPVYEARGTIYIKRGAMGFWVSQKTDNSGKVPLTTKEKEEFRRDYEQTYGITGGKSTTGITNQPMSFERSSMSIEELQPFDETLADAVAIYKVLRVPRHLVPSKDNSTFSNADTDIKSFYSDVIIPWAKRYADLWTTWLGIDTKQTYKQYIYADFSHIDILQENRKDRANVDQINGNVYLQRFQNGVGTLNDWIAASGNNISNLPIYTKRLFEMTPEELQQVKDVLNLKTAIQNNQQPQQNNADNSQQRNLILQIRNASFDEDEHPRAPLGSSEGGQFISKSDAIFIAGNEAPERMKELRIPPAWSDVKINKDYEADLLATGIDSKGRKQYIYSENATMRAAEAKFARNMELMNKQHSILLQNETNMLSHDKSISEPANVMSLIQTTGIRPGSLKETGAKVQAYGATTLEGRHVIEMADGSVRLQFVGKKGVNIDIPVKDKKVAAMLLDRKNKAGDNGKLFNVSDDELRQYTKKLNGGSFKPKDFRTLKGTSTAMELVKDLPRAKNMKEYKKMTMDVAKQVSEVLGNTPSIALKSYINPFVFLKLKP